MEGDLESLPDDAFALVVAAIDQPQAAARMLATCRRVGAAVPAPPVLELGPSAPMVVQVRAMSACLAAVGPVAEPSGSGRSGSGGLALAATHG